MAKAEKYDEEYEELLEKAMEMPGIADVMEIHKDADKKIKESTNWLKEESYTSTNSDSSCS